MAGFKNIVQTGMLAATLASARPALAQLLDVPASGNSLTPNLLTNKDAGELALEDLSPQAMLERYGTNTLFEIYTAPRFAFIQQVIGEATQSVVMKQIGSSAVFQSALKSIKLNEMFDRDGVENRDIFSVRLTNALAQAVGEMAKSHTTIADAMKQDTFLAYTIKENSFGLLNKEPVLPGMQAFLDKTEIRTFFDDKGNPQTAQFEVGARAVIEKMPLADLNKPEFNEVHLALRSSLKGDDVKAFDELLGNPWLRIPNAQTIGDVLFKEGVLVDGTIVHGTGLQLDRAGVFLQENILMGNARAYADKHVVTAAGKGISVYDYLMNPRDKTDAVTTLIFEKNRVIAPLYKLIKEGEEEKLLSGLKEHLQALPLSSCISTIDNVERLSPAKLREAFIAPSQNLLLSQMSPQYLEAVLGPQIAVVVAQKPVNTTDDLARQNAINTTTMGYFISRNKADGFESKQAEFLGGVDTPEVRARRVVDNLVSLPRPWKQFTSIHDGITNTIVPYSFNVNGNNTLTNTDYYTVAVPYGDLQKKVARHSHRLISSFANLDFKEVDMLPAMGGAPQGELFINADLSKAQTPIVSKVAGVAVGSLGRFTNRVDIIADWAGKQSVYDFIDTVNHEKGHGEGLYHPHGDNYAVPPLPGTVNEFDNHTVPGITKNITIMSYTPDFASTNAYYKPITFMPADILALQQMYGARYSDDLPNQTYHLHLTKADRVLTDYSPNRILVGQDAPLAQTIIIPPGGTYYTLDVSQIDGMPVKSEVFDLNKSAHELHLVGANGTNYTPTYVAVMHGSEIANAIVGGGAVIGTLGDNVLKTTTGGTLNGNGGHDTLIGGPDPTTFTGGTNHQDRFVIHAGSMSGQLDRINDFILGKDTIVAPEGTKKVVAYIDSEIPLTLQFNDGAGQELKQLELRNPQRMPLSDSEIKTIPVQTPEGKRLHVKPLHPAQPVLHYGAMHGAELLMNNIPLPKYDFTPASTPPQTNSAPVAPKGRSR